jgi:Acetyltransferase (GNAT) family
VGKLCRLWCTWVSNVNWSGWSHVRNSDLGALKYQIGLRTKTDMSSRPLFSLSHTTFPFKWILSPIAHTAASTNSPTSSLSLKASYQSLTSSTPIATFFTNGPSRFSLPLPHIPGSQLTLPILSFFFHQASPFFPRTSSNMPFSTRRVAHDLHFQAYAQGVPHPVGVIVCKQSPHRERCLRGYIAMLSVDKGYRKRGIGASLFSSHLCPSY